MPTLGGITAWISIGDRALPEYGTEIVDDQVKCYVEVPPSLPVIFPVTTPGSQTVSLPSPAPGNSSRSPTISTLDYVINWRIQDLTYTMVAVADIDGTFKIEKIHLGKGTITAARNTQAINSVPVTDDWSKCRMLTFVKLHAEENAQLPREQVGSIILSLYRSGRASLSSGLKTTATGFHTKTTPDVKSLVRATTVDGLYSKSHATGLGPITFGPPKKVWTAGTRDRLPYVTFEFLYRSRELITEALPDEGWELAPAPPLGNMNFGPAPQGGSSSHDVGSPSSPPTSFPPLSGRANVGRRPSIAKRAKKWASDMKQSTQSIKLPRGKDSGSKVEVVSTPMDAINNPFSPRSHDLPRTPAESVDEGEPPTPVPHDETQVQDEVPVASSSRRKPVATPMPDI